MDKAGFIQIQTDQGSANSPVSIFKRVNRFKLGVGDSDLYQRIYAILSVIQKMDEFVHVFFRLEMRRRFKNELAKRVDNAIVTRLVSTVQNIVACAMKIFQKQFVKSLDKIVGTLGDAFPSKPLRPATCSGERSSWIMATVSAQILSLTVFCECPASSKALIWYLRPRLSLIACPFRGWKRQARNLTVPGIRFPGIFCCFQPRTDLLDDDNP